MYKTKKIDGIDRTKLYEGTSGGASFVCVAGGLERRKFLWRGGGEALS
jgi:hypothetical protein